MMKQMHVLLLVALISNMATYSHSQQNATHDGKLTREEISERFPGPRPVRIDHRGLSASDSVEFDKLYNVDVDWGPVHQQRYLAQIGETISSDQENEFSPYVVIRGNYASPNDNRIINRWTEKVLPQYMDLWHPDGRTKSIAQFFHSRISGERGYVFTNDKGQTDRYYIKPVYCRSYKDTHRKLIEMMFMNFTPDRGRDFLYAHYKEGPGDFCFIGLIPDDINKVNFYRLDFLDRSETSFIYDESRIAFSRGPAAFVIRSERKDVSCLEFAEMIDLLIQDVIKKVDSGENVEEESEPVVEGATEKPRPSRANNGPPLRGEQTIKKE